MLVECVVSEADVAKQSHGPKISICALDDIRPRDEEPSITLIQSQSSHLVIYCFHKFVDEPY